MKTLVLLSGGVDSTITALLLKEQGYDITGLHLDLNQNRDLCNKIYTLSQIIGIKLIIKDISQDFNQKIISYFINSYFTGKTPNPCIICNYHIKINHAMELLSSLSFDYIATGHYAKIVYANGIPFIKKATDLNKDQSYFLAYIPQNFLEFLKFPLGDLTKEQVKEKANENNLSLLHEKESQDICFLKSNYRDFLKRYIKLVKKGDILDINGKKIGTHSGLFNYTIGQRSGIGIPDKYPLYVKKIDYNNNTLVVAPKEYLYESTVKIKNLNLFKEIHYLNDRLFDVKIRYRHPPEKAYVKIEDDKTMTLNFINPVFAPTPGQFAVLYEDDIVIACGEIC